MDICTPFEKKLYDLKMTLPGCEMQWGPEFLMLCVEISTMVKQQLYDVVMSLCGSKVQRGPAKLVSATHVCAILDQ